MTHVVLGEDHEIVRQGLRALIDAETDLCVVGEAGDGLETVRLAEQERPDVLVLDLMLPSLNGLGVARQLQQRVPEMRIVVLSMHDNEAYVVEALRNGALGYVLKNSGSQELLRAIRAVAKGERYLGPPLSEEAIQAYIEASDGTAQFAGPYDRLTNREQEVFQLTIEGHTSKAVAERLGISPRTVEKHRDNLMKKLDLHSQTDLVRFAMKSGLLPRAEGLGE